jgi:hypothetical protein
MRAEEIRDPLRKVPFQPFRIFLSNGKSYDILDPDLAKVGKNDLLLGIPAKDLPPGVADHFEFVALMHISNIEPILPTH